MKVPIMQEPYSREGNNPSSHSGSFWEREVLREVLLASYKEQRSARIWRNIWRVIGVILFLMFIASLLETIPMQCKAAGSIRQ